MTEESKEDYTNVSPAVRSNTVAWAVDQLKQEHFQRDPAGFNALRED